MFDLHRLSEHLHDSVAVSALGLHLLQAPQVPLPAQCTQLHHSRQTRCLEREFALVDLVMEACIASLTVPTFFSPPPSVYRSVDS